MRPRRYPGELEAKILSMHGQAGREWLRRIPETVDLCAELWGLEVSPPFPNLTYNYAAPVRTSAGTAAVLKLGFPAEPELVSEAAALTAFGGRGAVRLLAYSPELAALLLERAEPGDALASLTDDEAATRAAAGVMRSLWRPPPEAHAFPTLGRWAAGLSSVRDRFAGSTGPIPEEMVESAERLFRDLLSTAGPLMLLHGDLHHDNILSAHRDPWLAIDPKGVVGEPTYEAAAFLRNPSSLANRPDAVEVMQRRMRVLAEELGLDIARIRGWAVAHSVLSMVWSVEDHGSVPIHSLRLARQLQSTRV